MWQLDPNQPPKPLTPLERAEAAQRRARWRMHTFFWSGVLLATVVTGRAWELERQSPDGLRSTTTFWIGMALIGLAQLNAIELAVREAEVTRLTEKRNQ